MDTMNTEKIRPKGTDFNADLSSITGDHKNTKIYMELSKQHWSRPTLAMLASRINYWYRF